MQCDAPRARATHEQRAESVVLLPRLRDTVDVHAGDVRVAHGVRTDPDAVSPMPGTSFKIPVEWMDFQKVLDAPIAERLGGYPALAITTLLFAGVNFLSIMGIASGFESET